MKYPRQVLTLNFHFVTRSLSSAFLFILLYSPCTYAQKHGQPLIDSLSGVLPKTQKDTNRVVILNTLSFEYADVNADQALKYGREALALAAELHWKHGTAIASNSLGICCVNKGDCAGAIEYFEQVLKISEEEGSKTGVEHALGNIGLVYYSQKEYPKALDHYQKAMKIAEEIGDKKGISNGAGSIGNVYDLLKDYPRAQECFFKELQIDEELNDSSGIAGDFGSLGSSYLDQKEYTHALEYIRKSLQVATVVGDIYLQARNLDNLGAAFLSLASDTLKPGGIKTLPFPATKNALLDSSISYLSKGLAIDKELNEPDIIMEAFQRLAEAYRLKSDYKKSLEYTNSYRVIKDSLYTTENKIKIADIDAKHELELKQKQIEIDKLEIAKKHNERWFFITAILFLSVIAILFIKRQQLKEKKLYAEKKMAEAELDTASKLLDNFRQSVQEKNSILEQVESELQQYKNMEISDAENDTLLRLQQSSILTDEQWEDFRVLFEKVHKGFFKRIKEKMPDLTPAEVRFVALSKLKLSPKEMGSILGISPGSIRNYRLRLRRKLGLDDESNIEEIVDAI